MKNMKKPFAVALTLLVVLTSCAEASPKPSADMATVPTEAIVSVDADSAEKKTVEVKKVSNGNYPGGDIIAGLADYRGFMEYMTPDGAYYQDLFAGDRMSFIDFKTMNSFPVCSRPNCLHNDPETCSAFGISTLSVYDGHIYFVENTDEGANIYRASLDGAERKKVASLEGYSLNALFVSGNMGYTVVYENIVDGTGFRTLEENQYVETFDFKTGKLKNHGLLSHVYLGDRSGIIGEYGGKIYYISVGARELPEGVDLSSPDFFDVAHAASTTVICSFDPATGKISESELPLPGNREGMNWSGPDIVIAGDGYYVCQQGDTAIILSPDGSVKKIENHRIAERATDIPVNGMLFNTETLLATELSTGDVYALKDGAIPEDSSVIAYYDGCYITVSQFTREFKKLTPEDMFKEE